MSGILPAEEHARQTGEHPRVNTENNIANMTRQLDRLGLGHDERRSVATTDPAFYRWTQWIFLRLFDAWFDEDQKRGRPIGELVAELDAGTRTPKGGEDWGSADDSARRAIVAQYRLAYVDDAPVNWCPGLGTVLANEEVTADGRSERGNYPVFRRPLRQWMMRITAYADRLLEDLDLLDWTDSIKTMQRNWIGRSEGAHIDFGPIRVFTTRPDTVFGATYMVLAPEHALVDELIAAAWPERTAASWGEDGRVHRRHRGEPRERPGDTNLHRRLRADGIRHGCDHGGTGPGRTRLGVRNPVRSRHHPHGAASRRLRCCDPGRRRICRRWPRHQLRLPRRSPRGRGKGRDHRMARDDRPRRGHRHLQASRLAVQPPALLG